MRYYSVFKTIAICILLFALTLPCLYGFSPNPNGSYSCAPDDEGVFLPIIMYHSILNGRKGTYIISAAAFKNDVAALKKHGYDFVLPTDVIAYASGIGKLPPKPVMLTFDDGHFNFLYYALPILAELDATALVNIIGSFSQYSADSGDSANPNYSHLTWDEISQLVQSKRVEIGNHTYAMHKYRPRFGVSKLSSETNEDYAKKLGEDFLRLQNILEQNCGIKPQVFAYPFGKYTDLAEKTLSGLGIKMTLTCNEGVSKIGKNPDDLRLLKRINRKGSFSSSALIAEIKKYTPSN